MDLEAPIRTGTTAEWADPATAPTLALGEAGVDTQTRQLKIGDGSTEFPDLPALTPRKVSVTLVAGTKVTADAKIKTASKIVPVVRTLGTVTSAKPMLVAISNGVSFTVTSADATDTSTLDVLIWD